MLTIYGISNCDTVRKARKWLEANQVEYRFHDFRKDGLSAELLRQWCEQAGWEILLNKRGTTWRQQPDDVKQNIDEASAEQLMLVQPAMIKRPVMVQGDNLTIGFKPEDYAAKLL